MLHRLGDRRLGDGVEDDPLDRRGLDRLAAGQILQHVPADRLALAIGVRGQDQAVGALERLGDVREALGRFAIDLPAHGEIIVRPHRAILGGQVAHVAIGGQHRVVGAKITVDGFRLGGALDDDNFHAGLCAEAPTIV